MYAFDQTLSEQGEWPTVPGEWAGSFDAVGEAAVVYGSGSRLTATLRDGAPLVSDSLRTAAATHVVPASANATFASTPSAAPEPSAAATTEVTLADDGAGSLSTGALVGALVGTGAAAALLGATFAYRRRSRGLG